MRDHSHVHVAAPTSQTDKADSLFFHSYRHLAAVPESPSIFTLELTTLCNNFCSGCANIQLTDARKKGKEGRQEMREWEKIILAAKPYAKLVRLSGGEPTLHPDFQKIVSLLEESAIPYALLTTGRWAALRPAKLIPLLKKGRHFVGMLVSLHGSNSSSHHAFVESAPKAFDEACENIRLAAENGLAVYTNTVLTRFSCDEVELIVRLSLRLGAQYALFNRFLAHNHPLVPEEGQLFSALNTIEQLRQAGLPCRVGNNVPPCFAETSSEGAKAGFELCHIAPNGDIRPDNLAHLSFGNVLQEGLPSIWRSAGAEMYRMSFMPDCLRCKAFPLCRGGAKSLTFQHGLEKDQLMRGPLATFEPQKRDAFKNSLKYLALTSD